ncbi:hypothetical protein VNI00_007464 [Paramarasmius palmivorus]|uniref:F-box domain-containing protein n=1 Tax=Paramarasmius palmivorus TaxID=297713 RepID=A0AAW0D4X6_9AGAR
MNPQQSLSSLSRLPHEVKLIIVDYAARPDFERHLHHPRSSYADAVALSAACHWMRRVAMRQLLHTVIVESDLQLSLFVRSFHQRFDDHPSRLELDYRRLVRRLFATNIWERTVDQVAVDSSDLEATNDVLRGLEAVGVSLEASHLLYNVDCLALPPLQVDGESYRKVVLTGGPSFRWNPFTTTTDGLAILSRLTHLGMWDLPTGAPQSAPSSTVFKDIPFSLMSNLVCFAFPIWHQVGPAEEDRKLEIVLIKSIAGGSAFQAWSQGVGGSGICVENVYTGWSYGQDVVQSMPDSVHMMVLAEKAWGVDV